MNKNYKIVVVGLGYVGLSNAVLLAQHNEVIGVDISQERSIQGIMKRIKAKGINVFVYEPSLAADTFHNSTLISDIDEFKKNIQYNCLQ